MDYPSTVSHDVTGDLVYGARPQLALALLLISHYCSSITVLKRLSKTSITQTP